MGRGLWEMRGCVWRLVGDEDETGTWMDLWAGKVVVDAMCVKDGKAGISFGHED